jgi:competence protein ComEC
MVKNTIFSTPLLFAIFGSAGAYYVFGALSRARLPWIIPALIAALLLGSAAAVLRVLEIRREMPPPGSRRLKAARLCLLFALAGIAAAFAARTAAGETVSFGMVREKITGLSGVLAEDPRLAQSGRGMGRVSLLHTFARDGAKTSAGGTAQVFFPDESIDRLRSFGRGAEIYVDGTFLPPRENGAAPVFSAKTVHITKEAGPSDRFRTNLRLRASALYGEKTWGGLALALLFGMRDSLDSGLALAYRNAGLSHILALSGMHLGIIAAVLAFFLKKPLGVKAAAAVSSLCIVAYVWFAAVQPSLARAAIMYLLGACTVCFALPRKLPLVLGLSFIIQILVWPASGDTVSFILSYLALAGILLLSGPLMEMFRGIVPAFVASPLAASLGAFIASMTATALFFGFVQPAGIVAGLFVSPLTTVFMILSMVYPAVLAIKPLASVLDLVQTVLYRVMEGIVRFAGAVPQIRVNAWPLALAASCALAALVWFAAARLRAGEKLGEFAAT